jgi:pimeloyl-ACP methyl ester carboxylesterase
MRKYLLAPALLATFFVAATASAGPPPPDLNPIIFVHGSSGSAAQFASQKMRFTSNGYPQEYIRALEYDSSALNLAAVHAELDALIAQLQSETGRPQVDLLGHSLGTTVSQTYLSTPARAANVAHYVNIDGGSAAAPPGGVPTLALWAGADPPVGSIVGALNVTLAGQEHIETATSAEAFFEMFQFFRGEPPETTQVVPEPPGQVRIEGQVNFFPTNVGITGATLEVWEVDPATGLHAKKKPVATFTIDASGDWGPVKIHGHKSYELNVLRDGEADIDFFYEPFIRSDHFVRLNVATGLTPFIDTNANHTAVTVVRQREFCGDLGAGSDSLVIDGSEVINTTTASCASIALGSAAVFAFDDASDGVSHTNTVPFPFGPLAFLTATDLFIPSDPPARTVSVVTTPRTGGAARTVNVPNRPSTEARVVVNLNDFDQ